MGYIRRVTLRCLCEDLDTGWENVSEQRGFKELRRVAQSTEKDSKVVEALDRLPTTARASHPLVRSFSSTFESDGALVKRESISGLTNPHWWKQKTSRWRGAATDALILGDQEVWLCAGGIRADGDLRDFYKDFASSVQRNGSDEYLPAKEDRRVQDVEAKLARHDAWVTQLRLSTLICLAEAHDSGERRTLHVPRPGAESPEKPLLHITFDLDQVSEEAEQLTELFLTIDVNDPSAPNLVQSATGAIRSVLKPILEDWRVLPGAGTSEIWSTLISTEVLGVAQSAVKSGEIPQALVNSTVKLGTRAHYTRKGKIVDAMVDGNPVRGLCGQWFVPTANPDKVPICPACEGAHSALAGNLAE